MTSIEQRPAQEAYGLFCLADARFRDVSAS
jgi:hypothetical protein